MFCELCGRGVQDKAITRHHLVPVCLHHNKTICEPFGELDLTEQIAYLCKDCHSFIHSNFTEIELGSYYYAIHLINSDIRTKEWLNIIRTDPKESKLIKRKKRKQGYCNRPHFYALKQRALNR